MVKVTVVELPLVSCVIVNTLEYPAKNDPVALAELKVKSVVLLMTALEPVVNAEEFDDRVEGAVIVMVVVSADPLEGVAVIVRCLFDGV